MRSRVEFINIIIRRLVQSNKEIIVGIISNKVNILLIFNKLAQIEITHSKNST